MENNVEGPFGSIHTGSLELYGMTRDAIQRVVGRRRPEWDVVVRSGILCSALYL